MARGRTDFLVVHCSATPPSMDIGAREIDHWHRARGWLKIGYHFVIRRDGDVEFGRNKYEPGAHAHGYNHKSLGVCLVGGVAELDRQKPEDNFEIQQWDALRSLVGELRLEFPAIKVIGHNEISKKACPSFDVQAWLSTITDIPRPACATCGQPLPHD